MAFEVAWDRPYGFQAMKVVAADTLAEQPIGLLLATHLFEMGVRGAVTGTNGAVD